MQTDETYFSVIAATRQHQMGVEATTVALAEKQVAKESDKFILNAGRAKLAMIHEVRWMN